MPFTIVRQDITRMQVDAVVNAANTGLEMGGGVCGAIFRAAGPQQMAAACAPLAPIPVGGAALTPGFGLPAKYVIHAAGPVYNRWEKARCRDQLYSAYAQALALAVHSGCSSIAFPLISSGLYGYPKQEALEVARAAITGFLQTQELQVYLAVFDRESFVVGKALLGRVESYIDAHYIEAHPPAPRRLLRTERAALGQAQQPEELPPLLAAAMPARPQPQSLEAGLQQRIEMLDEPFSDALLRLIDRKGKTDVEVYKRANIDRKLFSKIRTGKGYTPKKPTILALAIALQLDLKETNSLLARAGYALSHASKFDVILEYFIQCGRYDIFEINEILFAYDQPLLGG